jgi:hypothetical protein
MRSYRKNGRTSAILKMVLPHTSGESQERFNSCYLSLAESYLALAEEISNSLTNEKYTAVISVDFEVLPDTPEPPRKENLVAIKRTHRIRCGEKSSAGAFLDFYNADKEIFIK